MLLIISLALLSAANLINAQCSSTVNYQSMNGIWATAQQCSPPMSTDAFIALNQQVLGVNLNNLGYVASMTLCCGSASGSSGSSGSGSSASGSCGTSVPLLSAGIWATAQQCNPALNTDAFVTLNQQVFGFNLYNGGIAAGTSLCCTAASATSAPTTTTTTATSRCLNWNTTCTDIDGSAYSTCQHRNVTGDMQWTNGCSAGYSANSPTCFTCLATLASAPAPGQQIKTFPMPGCNYWTGYNTLFCQIVCRENGWKTGQCDSPQTPKDGCTCTMDANLLP